MALESSDVAQNIFVQNILESLTRNNVLIRMNEDLSSRTTFRIGGKARCLLEPLHEAAAHEVVRTLYSQGVPWRVLGAGSNVLVSDKGIDEPIISLAYCKNSITTVSRSSIHSGSSPGTNRIILAVGGGVKVRKLLGFCIQMGWSGCEFLAGIPATIGGAVFMNAGTPDGVMADIVSSVDLIDPWGNACRVPLSQFAPQYRSSGIPYRHIVLGAQIELVETLPEKVAERIRSIILRRKTNQPITYPSAGCIFKNPPPDYPPAGWLIDRCGLKGCRIGDAQVSTIHANWIVNLGNATAQDVLRLISHVKTKVIETFGIKLEEEIQFWE